MKLAEKLAEMIGIVLAATVAFVGAIVDRSRPRRLGKLIQSLNPSNH